VEQARVLIVSDDAEFVKSLVQSWQRRSGAPEYAVSRSHGAAESAESSVVIMDGLEGLSHLSEKVLLAIAVTAEEPKAGIVPRVVQIRRSADPADTGWADIAAMLAFETVLRAGAVQRVGEVEHQLRESERFAALGHFISDARHGLGNALTSVLGNSELVLMDSDSELGGAVRGQLETIHAMSLKIHETLRRLSSLDSELQVAERQAEREALLVLAKAAGPH
jgi:signal transduction histidine kinase